MSLTCEHLAREIIDAGRAHERRTATDRGL
ncbi:hypothetical protein PMI18_02127 [Pseudomonas sp. GM102]|nr:hypothetical protein PMI18_02127 [Pseudomonas sp. GM102]